jgi:hypothetical protein
MSKSRRTKPKPYQALTLGEWKIGVKAFGEVGRCHPIEHEYTQAISGHLTGGIAAAHRLALPKMRFDDLSAEFSAKTKTQGGGSMSTIDDATVVMTIAAAEIERLRSENAQLFEAIEMWHDYWEARYDGEPLKDYELKMMALAALGKLRARGMNS